jgi:hypothetical protein
MNPELMRYVSAYVRWWGAASDDPAPRPRRPRAATEYDAKEIERAARMIAGVERRMEAAQR